MRTILHLSDLHFGRSDPLLLTALHQALQTIDYDCAVISGDLTQRATIGQFRQAKDFIAALRGPVLCVPGNHDIPLFNFFARFANPYSRYERFIATDLEPHYADSEIVVQALNSVRALRLIEGKISNRQLRRAEKFFASCAKSAVKIVMAHHPFEVPQGYPAKALRRAKRALKRFRAIGIDLILSGHLHSTLGSIPTTIEPAREGALIIQAGTAISNRLRREPNSFNVLKLAKDRLTVERYEYDAWRMEFLLARAEYYKKTPRGFRRAR